MKKKIISFFCMMLLTLSVTSCSKDSASESTTQTPTSNVSKMTLTVNGTTKNFNTFSVSNQTTTNGDYVVLTASQNGSATDAIEFTILKNQTGLNAKISVHFYYNGHDYFDSIIGDPYELALNITQNNTAKIIGSFSGQIAYFDNNTSSYVPVTITNGTFEYYY